MKLTKFGIIKDSNNSRGCAKIWVIHEGKGVKFWRPILENPEGRGRGPYGKSLPWGWYGHLLEPHIKFLDSSLDS